MRGGVVVLCLTMRGMQLRRADNGDALSGMEYDVGVGRVRCLGAWFGSANGDLLGGGAHLGAMVVRGCPIHCCTFGLQDAKLRGTPLPALNGDADELASDDIPCAG